LDAQNVVLRRELERFQGREIKTLGDGMLATFDGPARAIRCAETLSNRIESELGVQMRAGVHTGECEAIGDDLGGLAVHIGSRVSTKAQPGQVMVSSTVKDLVVGSGLDFADAGEHELKGVPGTWRLYRVAGRQEAAPLEPTGANMTVADKMLGRMARRAPGAMRALTRLAVKERPAE
jgi:class 3 adenylate cyclase